MKRCIRLTDGSKRRVSLQNAKQCESYYEWDGRCKVNKATGNPWEHETLYKTKKGAWIKHRRSEYQGLRNTWEEIREKDALEWLRKNTLKRVALTDFSGRWFDIEKAQRWEERVRHNGQFMVSCATGSLYKHETLYCTIGGHWILHSRYDWQYIPDKWIEIPAERAAKWLIVNNYELPESLRAYNS